MQTKLAKSLDNIFKYLVFFLISFIWCNYYSRNITVCLFASIIIATLFSFVTTKLFYVKENKKAIKLEEQKEMHYITTQLLFYSVEEQIDYFFNVLSFSNTTAQKTKTHIVLNKTIIVPIFTFSLSPNDYLNVATKHKQEKVVILTNKISNELETLLNTIEQQNITILTITNVYFDIIKPTGIKPKEVIKIKSTKKLKFKELLYVAFNKKNAKNYFFSGLLILFLSLIYRFSLYYQISGTILLLFSLFSHFNTRGNKQENKSSFNTQKNTE